MAIWNLLSPIYVKTPSTKEEWTIISNRFYERWNAPLALG